MFKVHFGVLLAEYLELTKKVLFLVSLATAKRVGELQAVSKKVSFSGGDIRLSYLPEFVAKRNQKLTRCQDRLWLGP